MILIQWSVNISVFVNYVVIVFGGPNRETENLHIYPVCFPNICWHSGLNSHYTNHSIRATGATILGYQTRNIMWHSRLRIYIPWGAVYTLSDSWITIYKVYKIYYIWNCIDLEIEYSIFLHTWNMTRHIFWHHWRMTSKVRKRTSRDTKNENKRSKFI
jgi:hypothetical protein